ncbi:MAG: autotransporter assembly complex family protein [Gammaproteobacteria bacterium]|nr:autotransporter assembly complex family protein [Gammaproteobacteria bacterium]
MHPRAPRRAWFALLLAAGMLAPGAWAAEVTVEIEGVEDAVRSNVEGYLGIWQYRNEEDLTPLSIRRLHARAREEIRNALVPFGYYAPDISARLVAPEDEDGEWLARYVIEPGIPVVVRRVDITVNGPDALRNMLQQRAKQSPLGVGRQLNHGEYSSLKDALLTRAIGRGFLDARFTTQQLRVDRNAHAAEILLTLDAGKQYFFGDVEFRQDLLDEDFLERYVEFRSGEPFDYGEMLDLRYALSDTDYYSNVEVRADRKEGEEQRVPVVVDATRNAKHRYTLGLGFGTDTGARLSAGWDNRYVNRRGHKTHAEARVSEVDESFGMSYTIPLKKPRTDRFVLTGSWEDRELGDERSITKVIGGNIIRMLGPWQRTVFLRYEEERATTTVGASATTLVLPGISFLKTRSDDPLFPAEGYKEFYEVTGASESLGSDVGFAQYRMQFKYITTPIEDIRALFRIELAGTAISEAAELPVSHRYFAGGDRSVRGFDYNTLGPQDADENVVGGKYMAVGSAELEYMFSENWGVAAFVDSGNAANDPDMELETGIGLGLRWRSPLGMIRLDFATPRDSELRPSSGVEIHISIGPDL